MIGVLKEYYFLDTLPFMMTLSIIQVIKLQDKWVSGYPEAKYAVRN